MILPLRGIFGANTKSKYCNPLIICIFSFVAARQTTTERQEKRVISRPKASYAQSYPQETVAAPVSCLRHKQIDPRDRFAAQTYLRYGTFLMMFHTPLR
jgi:hypothetical protein